MKQVIAGDVFTAENPIGVFARKGEKIVVLNPDYRELKITHSENYYCDNKSSGQYGEIVKSIPIYGSIEGIAIAREDKTYVSTVISAEALSQAICKHKLEKKKTTYQKRELVKQGFFSNEYRYVDEIVESKICKKCGYKE